MKGHDLDQCFAKLLSGLRVFPVQVGRVGQLIINTTEGKRAIADSYTMRRAALEEGVTYTTTMAGARAAVLGIRDLGANDVNRLQDLHQETAG